MNIRKIVGFVPQEELTVRDNILFSGRYRLPKSLTYQEIEQRTTNLLFELGTVFYLFCYLLVVPTVWLFLLLIYIYLSYFNYL